MEMQLPIDRRRPHLLLETLSFLLGDERVLAAEADEHLAGDVGGVLRPHGREARVEANDGLQVRAVTGELEDHRSAEAVADSCHLAGSV